jgi:hypothetical protein
MGRKKGPQAIEAGYVLGENLVDSRPSGRSARGLVAEAPESEVEQAAPPESEATGPTYTPEPSPVEEEALAPEATAEPEPAPEPTDEDSFEPDSAYGSSEGGSEETYEAPEAAPVESSEPAPAPAQPGPQFGGPR